MDTNPIRKMKLSLNGRPTGSEPIQMKNLAITPAPVRRNIHGIYVRNTPNTPGN